MSDDLATAVCEAIKSHLAHNGRLPWPSIARPYAAWAEAQSGTTPEPGVVRCRGCQREWVPTPLDDYYNPGATFPPEDQTSGLCFVCLVSGASSPGAEVEL
jgi:hypothetical protein